MRSTRTPKTESGGQTALLPKKIAKVGVSPLKCQGIKTRLVQFIADNIAWQGRGRWIEPFLGSAVVLFNLAPHRATVSDTNVHIIRFFRDIQCGALHEERVRTYLIDADRELRKHGQRYFNEIRERFNRDGGSLDFLFLNRSCYNGMMRFNRAGGFNVPFGHKPNRFRQAYVTKILNQIAWVRELIRGKDWIFRVADWKGTVAEARSDDFVYMDPPFSVRARRVFNEYDPSTFTSGQVQVLRQWLERLDASGISFLVSYAESQEADLLRQGFNSQEVTVRRNISGFASKRRKARELLITNCELIDQGG